jgi:putative hydrolase
MSDDRPSDRPSDDELPPDPFPGDPFAGNSNSSSDNPGSGAEGNGSTPDADLNALLSSLGSIGGMGPLFQQIAAMQQGQPTGLNWDVARQIALWSASGQSVESPPDPVERIKMERIVASVEEQVSAASGLAVSNGRVKAIVTTRAGWAAQSLEDYRGLLDRLASSLGKPLPGSDVSVDGPDPMRAMLGIIAPMMVSSQAGALIGDLATTSLGSYDIPVPRIGASEHVLFVLRNIDEFATEWSIPIDAARTHVAIVETAMHSVLRISHVRSRLHALIERFVGSYVIDPEAIGEQIGNMGGFDPSMFSGPSAAQGLDSQALLGAAETAEQKAIRADISLMLIPIVGFVDYLAAVTGARMLGDNRKVVEAWRRSRLASAKGKAAAGQLLGLTLDDDLLDQGSAFIGGLLQRGGSDAFATLWSQIELLPTRSEISAPGLWLARVGLAD